MSDSIADLNVNISANISGLIDEVNKAVGNVIQRNTELQKSFNKLNTTLETYQHTIKGTQDPFEQLAAAELRAVQHTITFGVQLERTVIRMEQLRIATREWGKVINNLGKGTPDILRAFLKTESTQDLVNQLNNVKSAAKELQASNVGPQELAIGLRSAAVKAAELQAKMYGLPGSFVALKTAAADAELLAKNLARGSTFSAQTSAGLVFKARPTAAIVQEINNVTAALELLHKTSTDQGYLGRVDAEALPRLAALRNELGLVATDEQRAADRVLAANQAFKAQVAQLEQNRAQLLAYRDSLAIAAKTGNLAPAFAGLKVTPTQDLVSQYLAVQETLQGVRNSGTKTFEELALSERNAAVQLAEIEAKMLNLPRSFVALRTAAADAELLASTLKNIGTSNFDVLFGVAGTRSQSAIEGDIGNLVKNLTLAQQAFNEGGLKAEEFERITSAIAPKLAALNRELGGTAAAEQELSDRTQTVTKAFQSQVAQLEQSRLRIGAIRRELAAASETGNLESAFTVLKVTPTQDLVEQYLAVQDALRRVETSGKTTFETLAATTHAAAVQGAQLFAQMNNLPAAFVALKVAAADAELLAKNLAAGKIEAAETVFAKARPTAAIELDRTNLQAAAELMRQTAADAGQLARVEDQLAASTRALNIEEGGAAAAAQELADRITFANKSFESQVAQLEKNRLAVQAYRDAVAASATGNLAPAFTVLKVTPTQDLINQYQGVQEALQKVQKDGTAAFEDVARSEHSAAVQAAELIAKALNLPASFVALRTAAADAKLLASALENVGALSKVGATSSEFLLGLSGARPDKLIQAEIDNFNRELELLKKDLDSGALSAEEFGRAVAGITPKLAALNRERGGTAAAQQLEKDQTLAATEALKAQGTQLEAVTLKWKTYQRQLTETSGTPAGAATATSILGTLGFKPIAALEAEAASLKKILADIKDNVYKTFSSADTSQITNIIKTRLEEIGKASEGVSSKANNVSRAFYSVGRAFLYFAAISIVFELKNLIENLIKTGDETIRLQQRIKILTDQTSDVGAQTIFYQLAQDADRLRAPISDAIEGFTRIQLALKGIGGSVDQARQLNEILILTGKIGGQTQEEISRSTVQFTQALGLGVLRGQDLRSITQQNQLLVQTLVEGLNATNAFGEGVKVTVGDLQKLGQEGKLTFDLIVPALISQYPKLREMFVGTPTVAADAWEQFKNQLVLVTKEINDQIHFTEALVKQIYAFRDAVRAYRDYRNLEKEAQGSTAKPGSSQQVASQVTLGYEYSLDSVIADTIESFGLSAIGLNALVPVLRTRMFNIMKTALEEAAAQAAATSDLFRERPIEQQITNAETGYSGFVNQNFVGPPAPQIEGPPASLIGSLQGANAVGTEKTFENAYEALNKLSDKFADPVGKIIHEFSDLTEAYNYFVESANKRKAVLKVGIDDAELADIKKKLEDEARKLEVGTADLAEKLGNAYDNQTKKAFSNALGALKSQYDGTKVGLDAIAQLEQDAAKRRVELVNYYAQLGLVSEKDAIQERGQADFAGELANFNKLKGLYENKTRELEAARDIQAISPGVGDEERLKRLTDINNLENEANKLVNEQNASYLKLLESLVKLEGAEAVRQVRLRDTLTAIDRQTQDYAISLDKQVQAQQLVISLIGQSATAQAQARIDQQARLAISDEQLKIDREIQNLQLSKGSDEEINKRKQALKDFKDLTLENAAAMKTLAAAEVEAQNRIKGFETAWQGVSDVFTQFVTDLQGGWSNAITNMRNTLKNTLVKGIAELGLRTIVLPIFAQITGLSEESIAPATSSPILNALNALLKGPLQLPSTPTPRAQEIINAGTKLSPEAQAADDEAKRLAGLMADQSKAIEELASKYAAEAAARDTFGVALKSATDIVNEFTVAVARFSHSIPSSGGEDILKKEVDKATATNYGTSGGIPFDYATANSVIGRKGGAVSVPSYNPVFDQAAEAAGLGQYGYGGDLLRYMALQESSFNTNAVSSKGAQGLMQFTPATAKSIGLENAFNPEQSIVAAAKLMRQLLDQFNGDVEKALIAYNAGPKVALGQVIQSPENKAETDKFKAALLPAVGPGSSSVVGLQQFDEATLKSVDATIKATEASTKAADASIKAANDIAGWGISLDKSSTDVNKSFDTLTANLAVKPVFDTADFDQALKASEVQTLQSSEAVATTTSSLKDSLKEASSGIIESASGFIGAGREVGTLVGKLGDQFKTFFSAPPPKIDFSETENAAHNLTEKLDAAGANIDDFAPSLGGVVKAIDAQANQIGETTIKLSDLQSNISEVSFAPFSDQLNVVTVGVKDFTEAETASADVFSNVNKSLVDSSDALKTATDASAASENTLATITNELQGAFKVTNGELTKLSSIDVGPKLSSLGGQAVETASTLVVLAQAATEAAGAVGTKPFTPTSIGFGPDISAESGISQSTQSILSSLSENSVNVLGEVSDSTKSILTELSGDSNNLLKNTTGLFRGLSDSTTNTFSGLANITVGLFGSLAAGVVGLVGGIKKGGVTGAISAVSGGISLLNAGNTLSGGALYGATGSLAGGIGSAIFGPGSAGAAAAGASASAGLATLGIAANLGADAVGGFAAVAGAGLSVLGAAIPYIGVALVAAQALGLFGDKKPSPTRGQFRIAPRGTTTGFEDNQFTDSSFGNLGFSDSATQYFSGEAAQAFNKIVGGALDAFKTRFSPEQSARLAGILQNTTFPSSTGKTQSTEDFIKEYGNTVLRQVVKAAFDVLDPALGAIADRFSGTADEFSAFANTLLGVHDAVKIFSDTFSARLGDAFITSFRAAQQSLPTAAAGITAAATAAMTAVKPDNKPIVNAVQAAISDVKPNGKILETNITDAVNGALTGVKVPKLPTEVTEAIALPKPTRAGGTPSGPPDIDAGAGEQAAKDFVQRFIDNVNAALADATQATADKVLAFVNAVNIVGQALPALAIQLAALDPTSMLAFVDALGGAGKVAEQFSFLGANFVTSSDKTAQATTQLNAAFTAAGVTVIPQTHEAFLALLSSFDLTTEAGRAAYASVLGLSQAFVQVHGTADQAAQRLAGFLANFTTDAQRAADATASINTVFAGLGVAVPQTHAELLALFNSYDDSTVAGHAAREAIMGVSDAFVLIYGTAQQAAQALAANTNTFNTSAAFHSPEQIATSTISRDLGFLDTIGQRLGITLPTTARGFGQLLDSVIAQQGPNSEMARQLLALVPIYSDLDTAQQQAAQSATQLISTLNQAAKSETQKALDDAVSNINNLVSSISGTLGDKDSLKLTLIAAQIENFQALMDAAGSTNAVLAAGYQRDILALQRLSGATTKELARFTELSALYDDKRAEQLVPLEEWYKEQVKIFAGMPEALAALAIIFQGKWDAIVNGTSDAAQSLDDFIKSIQDLAGKAGGNQSQQLGIQLALSNAKIAKLQAQYATLVSTSPIAIAIQGQITKLQAYNSKLATEITHYASYASTYGSAIADQLVELELWYTDMQESLSGNNDALAILATIFQDKWNAIVTGVDNGVNSVIDSLKKIREYLEQLKLSELSPLTPFQKFGVAQSQYQTQLGLAQSGNAEALSNITQYADSYLKLARDAYASSPAYTAIYDAVTAALTALTGALTPATPTTPTGTPATPPTGTPTTPPVATPTPPVIGTPIDYTPQLNAVVTALNALVANAPDWSTEFEALRTDLLQIRDAIVARVVANTSPEVSAALASAVAEPITPEVVEYLAKMQAQSLAISETLSNIESATLGAKTPEIALGPVEAAHEAGALSVKDLAEQTERLENSLEEMRDTLVQTLVNLGKDARNNTDKVVDGGSRDAQVIVDGLGGRLK